MLTRTTSQGLSKHRLVSCARWQGSICCERIARQFMTLAERLLPEDSISTASLHFELPLVPKQKQTNMSLPIY
jgi:hypothetical protein